MSRQRWFVVLDVADEEKRSAEDVATWLAIALTDVSEGASDPTVYADWDGLAADREAKTGPFASAEQEAPLAPAARRAAIAARNDRLRTTGQGGEVFITRGIQATGQVDAILTNIRLYADFGPDNDPYGEHDFGVVEHGGARIFWKIDYYNPTLDGGEDPLSPDCRRVLTVMLAEEY